jgi:hypothetical protein
MNLLAINNIYDFQETLRRVKNARLRAICKDYNIKCSRKGVTNKYVLLKNIYEYIFGMLPEQHSDEHRNIIFDMSYK